MMAHFAYSFILLLSLVSFIVQAAVHRIDLTHQRVPADVYRLVRGHDPPRQRHSRLLQQQHSATHTLGALHRLRQAQNDLHTLINGHKALPANAITTSVPLNITDYGMLLLGNVSLGSPAQEFHLDFDLYKPNLYVVGQDALYYDSWAHAYTSIDDKRLYNSSASSSYTASSANFSIDYEYLNGSVVNDSLQVGGLSAGNVSFEVASVVDSYLQGGALDGTFGLRSMGDENATVSLLSQLQSQLDSPVFTYHLDLSYGESTGSGQIVLGSLAPDMCGSNWTVVAREPTTPIDYEYYDLPEAVVVNVTTIIPGDTTGCEYFVDIPLRVDVFASGDSITSGYQVVEVFIQASGADYNKEKERYELSHDKKRHAQPVYFHMADGGVFQVDPEDYIVEVVEEEEVGGRCDGASGYKWLSLQEKIFVLNVDNSGDWDDVRDIPAVGLNQQFVKHHCFSKNIQTGVWSIASVLKK